MVGSARLHPPYIYSSAGIQGSSIKHARFNEEWVMAGDPAP